MKRSLLAVLLLLICVEQASAVDFMPMGQALKDLLGTPKVAKKSFKHKDGKTSEVYYVKGAPGAPAKVAVLERGIYEPDCTHTWAIGIDPASGKVERIHVVEMKCQHAFPCQKESFLGQYIGKGPAEATALKGKVHTIAKATGTSDLTSEAVVRSVTAYQSLKSSL